MSSNETGDKKRAPDIWSQWIPLPEEYPREIVDCVCERKDDCEICAGLGWYYVFKRKPGQLMFDEMYGESSHLGD